MEHVRPNRNHGVVVLFRNLPSDGPVTIGRPIANTQLHVLDRYEEPAPVGVPGELHIGGDGVANGYFRRDELTAEKFIADPFGSKPRLYRTGDFARRLPERRDPGPGPADRQMKFRGFRIELGEIEAVLSRRPVGAAAVALREDIPGRPMLVGYLVEDLGAPQSDEGLRAKLSPNELPDYMIPSVWVRLGSADDAERETRSRRVAGAECCSGA